MAHVCHHAYYIMHTTHVCRNVYAMPRKHLSPDLLCLVNGIGFGMPRLRQVLQTRPGHWLAEDLLDEGVGYSDLGLQSGVYIMWK